MSGKGSRELEDECADPIFKRLGSLGTSPFITQLELTQRVFFNTREEKSALGAEAPGLLLTLVLLSLCL